MSETLLRQFRDIGHMLASPIPHDYADMSPDTSQRPSVVEACHLSMIPSRIETMNLTIPFSDLMKFIFHAFLPMAMSACLLTSISGALFAQDIEAAKTGMKVLTVRKIWDEGKHNAFTDLIRFRDAWYCTFRESEGHVGGDGTIRVLRSKDGKEWTSTASISEPGIDLRDPKFSIMPDGKLMIVAGGSVYKGGKTLLGRQPRVMISYEGSNWSAPQRVLGEGDWLWRVTWNKDVAWGISYIPQARSQPAAKAAADKDDKIEPGPADWKLKLVKSTNGFDWEVVKYLDVPGFANESTVRFLPDDTMVAFVRREAGNKFGWIGTSKPPYTEWTWTETNHRLGGPNFIVLAAGTMIAGSREHTDKGSRTALGHMTTTSYMPELLLPSSGDNSYPGLVFHDGKLWVSYYSSHEGKSSIYLAEIEIPSSK